MLSREFLAKILPTAGWYILDTPNTGGEGFRHYMKGTITEVVDIGDLLDEAGNTTYHACASFENEFIERVKDGKTYKARRVQENVKYLRSLWLDIDVGPADPKKYQDQAAALTALVGFLRATKLPVPMMVSSGYGVHVYWPLAENILPGQWNSAASMLKALCVAHEFKCDHSRTTDSASVLRPVGSMNRKDARNPREVRLLNDAPAAAFLDLYKLLERACVDSGVDAKPKVTRASSVASSVNAQFMTHTEWPNSYAEEIANKCQQVRLMRDTRGNLPEPQWYASIQVLRHTVEGRDLIHAWSSGHPGYSEDETDRKIAQLSEYGPTTCAKFAEVNPSGCIGCSLKAAKKVTSPIQTGVRVQSAPAPRVELPTLGALDPTQDALPAEVITSVELPNPPPPFRRAADGLFIVDGDGIATKFHTLDLYPYERQFDEHDGFETVLCRHNGGRGAWSDFSFPAALLEDAKGLKMYLRSQGVHYISGGGNAMVQYLDTYVQTLRDANDTRHKYASMGWQDDGSFVLGTKLLRPDGKVEHAGISSKGGDILRSVKSAGSLEEWVKLTEFLGRPGFEAHAFSFLAGAGAPFLKLMGHRGATISMLGRTGTGKTLIGKLMLSIYGEPTGLVGSQGDTPKAKIERIGFMRNLPVYIDELTNIDPALLSSTIYAVSEGRGPVRLRPDGTPRSSSEWSTFLMVSTNQSLQAKLRVPKGDPEAEAMRLFEYTVTSPGDDNLRDLHRACLATLPKNYGVAGERLLHWAVTQDPETITKKLMGILEFIDTQTGGAGKERFWNAVVAAAIYAGGVMKALGLIKFDPNTLFPWAMEQIKTMRGNLLEHKSTAPDTLSIYLDEHTTGRLVVDNGIGMGENGGIGSGIQGMPLRVLKAPTGPLTVRVEVHTGMAFISRKAISDYLSKRHLDYATLRRSLSDMGILIDNDSRRILGGGTFLAGAKLPCWKINLAHPDMSGILDGIKLDTAQ